MTNFVDQLRLAEQAKEDIYFARIDRELIDALHQRRLFEDADAAEKVQHSMQHDDASEQTATSGDG